MSAFLLVSTGGFIGANLRYWISLWATRRYGTDFPVGTLIANLCGSLLLGLVMGILAGSVTDDREMQLLLATGLLGAETTFSTYTFETVALLRRGYVGRAVGYFLGSAGLGLIAVTSGLLMAYLITDGI